MFVAIKKFASRVYWKYTAGLLGLMLSYQASVHAADGFSPSADDKSVALLSAIFKGLFDDGVSALAPTTGWENAIWAINQGAMTLAFIFVAYTLTFATMQTAHDGEMLGKKWSSAWLPIRYSIGTALMVPIQTYCLIQYIVAWALLQGIGLADGLWFSFIEATINPTYYEPKAVSPKTMSLVQAAFNSEACVAAINYENQENGKPQTAAYFPPTGTGKDSLKGSWGTPEGTDLCGNVIFNPQGTLPNAVAAAPTASPSAGTSQPLSGTQFSRDLTAMDMDAQTAQQIHIQAFEGMRLQVKPLAIAFTNDTFADQRSPDTGLSSTLLNLGDSYSKQLVSGATNAINGVKLESLNTAMKHDGWMLAGSWFMRASIMQDVLQRVLSGLPSTNKPKLESVKRNAFDRPGTVIVSISTLFVKSDFTNASMVDKASGSFSGESAGMREMAQIQSTNKLLMNLKDDLTALQKDMETRSPLMSLKDFGDRLLQKLQDLLSASTSANQTSVMRQTQSTAVTFMFILGSAFGVYLPMLPFVLFMATSIAWILLACEAVVAAPLWAAMKFAPGGEDMMGSSKNGYGMLLGVAIRPAFIVLGLCAALIVIDPLLNFFNSVFFVAVKNSLQGGTEQMFILLAVGGIYMGLMQQLITKTFSLIYEFPEKIPNWMGLNMGGGSFAQFASSSSQKLESSIQNSAGGVVGMSTSIASQVAQGIAGKEITGASATSENHDNQAVVEPASAKVAQGIAGKEITSGPATSEKHDNQAAVTKLGAETGEKIIEGAAEKLARLAQHELSIDHEDTEFSQDPEARNRALEAVIAQLEVDLKVSEGAKEELLANQQNQDYKSAGEGQGQGQGQA